MGRMTFAGLGIVAALLATTPVRASSLAELGAAMGTDSAASGSAGLGAGSALHTVKSSLQRSMPAFTPPKIDTPVQMSMKTSSAPSPRGSSSGGTSGWHTGAASHGGGSQSKSSWATKGQGGSSSKGATGQCWAKASTASRTASAGSAWK